MFDGISLKVLSEVSAWIVVASGLLILLRQVSNGKWYPAAFVKVLQDTIDTQAATIDKQAETIVELQKVSVAGVRAMQAIQSGSLDEKDTT